MYTLTNLERNETKYVIKEAPGSRKVSFIGNKLAKGIDLLAFVSKENLLLKHSCQDNQQSIYQSRVSFVESPGYAA